MNTIKNIDGKKLAIDVLYDIIGGIFIALGAYNFAAAAHFPLVGFTGIALITHHLFGLPIGAVSIALNIPVAIICYKILGKKYFLNSIKSLIITSAIIDYIAPKFPVYTGDTMLAAICTGVLSGIGYALIYMRGSSTGGADFIILTIKAKKPYMTIGRIAFIMDCAIVMIGAAIVSKSVNGLIYGILISYIISMVIDKLMFGLSSGKMALIVTDKPGEIAAGIDDVIERGATFLKAKGSYSEEDKSVVMCACSNKQTYRINEVINEVDPKAFMIIVESHEVFGEGFGRK
ncbi:MAG: YitT family protein [Eubacterium sp.]|nr:YitT family protein [Eubacterium sp.]